MGKYRGFEGEVPTLGCGDENLGLTPKPGYEYVYPELYASPSYRGPLQQQKIPGYVAPTAVSAPVTVYEPPPVIQVPPQPAPPVLPPPVPGEGPPDLMLPDDYTDDQGPLSPVSIGPAAGAGPAGSPGPGGNGGAEIEPGKGIGNNALFWAAVAAAFLLGG